MNDTNMKVTDRRFKGNVHGVQVCMEAAGPLLGYPRRHAKNDLLHPSVDAQMCYRLCST